MPLVRVQLHCKETLIPDKKGNPIGGLTCKYIPLGQKPPPGYNPVGSAVWRDDLDLADRTVPRDIFDTMCEPDSPAERGDIVCNVPDKTIAPRTRMTHFGQPRNIMAPPKGTAAFSLGGLAANTESAPLTLSEAGIPRAFTITGIILTDVTANEIIVTVYVGGEEAETFTGDQLAPATANPCNASACGTIICAGSIEDITLTVTNITGSALGAADAVRILGNLALEGDPNFVDCWAAAARQCGMTPKACGLGGCGEAVP